MHHEQVVVAVGPRSTFRTTPEQPPLQRPHPFDHMAQKPLESSIHDTGGLVHRSPLTQTRAPSRKQSCIRHANRSVVRPADRPYAHASCVHAALDRCQLNSPTERPSSYASSPHPPGCSLRHAHFPRSHPPHPRRHPPPAGAHPRATRASASAPSRFTSRPHPGPRPPSRVRSRSAARPLPTVGANETRCRYLDSPR